VDHFSYKYCLLGAIYDYPIRISRHIAEKGNTRTSEIIRKMLKKYKKSRYQNSQSSHVGDIPNRYTSDVVLNQQARVAHQGWHGGFTIPGGLVAED
jgi:hypothetical protein